MKGSTPFSQREKDVVAALLQGRSNKQIAAELGISNRTVEFHLTHIYAKLGVGSRSEAILKLTESDLRESADAFPGISTVENPGDSAENGSKPFLWRMPVKKLYPILGGVVVMLVAAAMVFQLVEKEPEPTPAAPVELTPVTNLFGAAPSATAAPARTEDLSPTGEPDPVPPVKIPPHTVNGYTAEIESYYVDTSHVLFQVRISGGDVAFGDEHYYDRIESPELYDENGNVINTSGGFGPAVDPALIEFSFVPVTLLTGDHFRGQFAFDLADGEDDSETLARFRFDVDLPIYPERRFFPKQVATANGLDMLLDSVTVTPTFTQAYLCFPPPSFAPWTIGSQTTLRLGERQADLYNRRLLFGSDLGGDRRAGSEPYWAPPTKDGRCIKIGFPVGSDSPGSLTLAIPRLEQEDPEALLTDRLARDYPGLRPKEAYHTFLEEHGKVHEGPWVFIVELTP